MCQYAAGPYLNTFIVLMGRMLLYLNTFIVSMCYFLNAFLWVAGPYLNTFIVSMGYCLNLFVWANYHNAFSAADLLSF